MNAPSPSTRKLARRLLAAIRAAPPPSGSDGNSREHEVVQVCEVLRVALSRFAGPDGFTALLRRALTLARAEVPGLQHVRLGADSRVEGLDAVAGGTQEAAAIALASHLLELLVTFIGEPLTLRVMREGWPDIDIDPGPK